MLDEWIRKAGDKEYSALSYLSQKGRYILVIVICLGVLALIWPGDKTEKIDIADMPVKSRDLKDKRVKLEGELVSILAQIKGAGKVEVSLTLSSDGIRKYASNTRDEKRETTELDRNGGERKILEENTTRDLAVSNGNALLIEECPPEVAGVLVVADGARDAVIKEKLTDATVTLLNISPHQVRVMAREEGPNDN